jgi:SRSO17 transposase
MTILEHPDAQAVLQEAVLTSEQVQELAERIEPFLERYFPLFQRREQRLNAQLILEGKLSNLSRKTSEPIAHFVDVRRENLQDFIGSAPWKDRAVLGGLRQHVIEVWGDPKGVLTADSSGFPKKGEHSCGVKRQWCGRLGKIDNCQIGVFLGYVCRHGHTLLDHRLFLPREWAEDSVRRAECHVPEAIAYKEIWEIQLDIIDANKDVPHAGVVCDSECGRVNEYRAGLRQRNECYVVDVREDLRLRDLRAAPPERQGPTGRRPSVPPQTHAAAWAVAQPASAWQRFKIRDGEKRPLVVEAAETWVETFEESRTGPVERFVTIRTVDNPDAKTWYSLSNAEEGVPLAEVVWAHAQRHWQEASLGEGKSEVGLDEYEVRSWVGWHHHMTMSLLALWFLALERGRVQKKTPALTVSILREAFSRILALGRLTLAGIVRELNETLKRKEEARIYHYRANSGHYPPRRGTAEGNPTSARREGAGDQPASVLSPAGEVWPGPDSALPP